MGCAKYVGRVGALAVALGIGTAVITTPGIAWADETGAASNDNPSQNGAGAGTTGGVAAAGGTDGQVATTGGATTGSQDTGEHQAPDTTGTGTTTTTNQGSTTTTVGGGSSPTVTFGNSSNTGSIGTHQEDPPPLQPSGTAQPIIEATSPSTVEETSTASAPPSLITEPTVTATVDGTVINTATASPNTPGGAVGAANLLALGADPSATTNAGLPTVQDTGQASAARMSANPNAQGAGVAANSLQTNTFNALVTPALPVPTVPPPTLFQTVLALPGTIISFALNLITQALAPLIGPGAPADNPVLWGVLAFVRRQFNETFANSAPALAPRQTGQDLNDAQVHGTFGGTDADGDRLAYSVPTSGLGAPVHGTVAIDQATGTYTYTPISGYVGKDYFFVTADDATAGPRIHALGQTNLAAARVDVTVAATSAANTAPVAANDSFTAVEDTALTMGNVLTNDTDADGDHLVAKIVTGPAHAANFALNSDGTFSYTPVANYNGPDSFSYKAFDGTIAGNTAVAAITVTAVNDAPVAVNDRFTTAVNTALATGNVLTNDTDVDGNTLRAVPVSKATAQGGIVAIRGDGTFTYTPKTDFVGADTFSYTVTDGSQATNATADAVVTVTVVAVGPLPTAAIVGKPDVDGVVTGTVNGVIPGGPAATYSLYGRPRFADQFTLDETTGAFSYRPTDAARIASVPGGADYDVFTVQLQSSAGTSIVPIKVDIAPPATVVPVAGIPVGPIMLVPNGFSYQLVEDDTGTTAVQVVSPSGRSILTNALPGTVRGSLIARPNGDVVVVTTTSGAVSGFARSAAPASSDVHVTLIDANGVLTSTSVSGLAIGTAAVAADGTVYQTIRTQEPVVLFGNDRTLTNFVVIRVSASGTFSTVTAGTVPGGTLYGDPIGLQGIIDFTKGGVVVGSDGTAYQGFSGVILATDGNNYETKVGVLIIPRAGNAFLSTLFTGDSASQVVAGGAGTAYLSYRGFDPTDFGAQTWTAVLTVTPTGSTTRIVPESDDPFAVPPRIVVGQDGTAYQAVSKDGNVILSIIKAGSVTTRTVAASDVVGDLHVSDTGVAYQLVGPGPRGASADRVVVLRSDGSSAVVTLGAEANGDLQVGPDGKAYVHAGTQTLVITPSGGRTAVTLGGTSASDVTFAPSGTAYQAVSSGGGFFIKNLTTGRTSDTATVVGPTSTPTLAVGPDGTAVFTVFDIGTNPRTTKILAMTAFGMTTVNTSLPGSPANPVVFASDGTGYIVISGKDASGAQQTTVSAVTNSGVTTVLTAPGYASPVSVAANDTVRITLTTYSATGGGFTQTYQLASVMNPLPQTPYAVTKSPVNASNGVSTVKITPTSGQGTPTYTGSTTSPLGDVQVNSDGTVVFTPSVAGRQLAAENNRSLYASFFVTATDSDGHQTFIPMTLPLRPADYPTQDKPLPHSLQDLIDHDGSVTDVGDIGVTYGLSPLKETHVVVHEVPPILVNGQLVTAPYSYSATWTRTRSLDAEDWPIDPISNLPVDPDVYVIDVYHPAGAVFDDDFLVLGYRKMELGDAVTVRTDVVGFFAQGHLEYAVVTFRPGTFPKDWFQTRPDPDGEVGGYIFNNEISSNTWEPWQDQEDDFENIYNYDESRYLQAPALGAGSTITLDALQLSYGAGGDVGDLITAEKTVDRIINGVKVGKDGLELIPDINGIQNEYGGTTTPVFLVGGAVRSTPPPIHIPD